MVIYSTVQLLGGKNLTFQDILQGTQGLYFKYLTVYLCMFLLIAIGFVFLIIPGIYIATIFVFADLIVVVERASFMEAFSRSYDLVHNRFWQVLQFLSVIILISLIPSLISSFFAVSNPQFAQTVNKVLAVFTMPYYIIAQVILYFEIKAIPQEPQSN